MWCVTPVEDYPGDDALEVEGGNCLKVVNHPHPTDHEKKVEHRIEDVHCVEDSIRANAVLQVVDQEEGSALQEEVEDDGSVEPSLLRESQ